jgi:TolB-like protein/tetratricopeptide (TPR) repeat protein/phage shock protein PspC (stress-responsive transcriptional regulator)
VNAETFFAELKRRKVYRVAIAYVVAGWALAQGIAQVLPVFDIPNWVVRLLVVLIVLGFPVALTLSWFFDFTRYGIVRTPDRAPQPRIDAVDPSISQEKSIAVLPFKDLSAGPERDYLGEGIAEEILTALSKVDNLRVAARRSSFWFKDRDAELSEVASKLNVDHVVEGSIRREGNRIRVTAELTECCQGFTLWSETFEREFQGIFALQDEITRAIVEALKLKLELAPATARAPSMEAYDLYLRGLFLSDKSSEEALRKSLEFFERALEKDPRFARAWTSIAKSWLWLADAYVEPLEAYSKVREAAVNAINIDDSEAEAHVYLAETKRILDWDLRGAESEYLRALEIDSNSTTSNYFIAAFYAAIGDREKTLTYLSRTAKIDPASLWVSNFACEIYRYFGLIDEAMAAGERSLQLDPTFLYSEPLLAALYREMGRFDDAIALYKKSQNLSGRVPFGLAITYAKMNRREEAREILKAACASRGGYTPGDAIAHVHVVLQENEEAMRELQRGYEEHSSSLHFIGIAPEFAPLRPDKRFVSIVKEIGLNPQKVFAVTAA